MLKKALTIALSISLVACFMLAALPAYAKVTAEEAERLKKDLTPFGAERAGNAEGTIPAWDGGMCGIPDNVTYELGDPATRGLQPDPYADDKVLFSITAENLDKYKDKISPGVLELFKKNPDTFRMDVYPSHRPTCMPQWVYDNTYQNALNAELIGDGALGFKGAHGGIPFPIVKNGAEAIYNHQFRWAGKGSVDYAFSLLVHEDGSMVRGGGAKYTYLGYYYSETPEGFLEKGGWSTGVLIEYFEPARRKGEIILSLARCEIESQDTAAWQYMPGQRRVRRAPSIGYDTPNPTYGGYATYDDAYMYNNKIDRFTWKLIGKREMYVPYNNYAIETADLEDLCTPHHLNPKYLRWELHRVWEVEATLREGSRHCYGRRVFFCDEDSSQVLLRDNYDTRGSLWRMGLCCTKMAYEIPAYRQRSTHHWDFQVSTYCATQLNQGMPMNTYEYVSPPEVFTPQYVRKLGKR